MECKKCVRCGYIKHEKTNCNVYGKDYGSHLYKNTDIIECKKDGNMYRWLYGEDLQVGMSGFRETKHDALIDFCRHYLKETNDTTECQ